MAEWYKKIPNWLTFLRLTLIPVFVVFLTDPTPATLRVAAVIFIFAAITDYADGIIARRYKAVTDVGKLLDPLADKILVMAALVMLTAIQDEHSRPMVPSWMVVLILAREFWITGLRAMAAAQGTIVPAGTGGKVKSFLQMVSIVMILLGQSSFDFFGYRLTWQFVGLNVLLVSVIFSLISAIEYTRAIMFPVAVAAEVDGEESGE